MALKDENQNHRYRAFDSMRSLAAFVVMLFHAAAMYRFYLIKLPWPFSGILDPRAAVVFFFVLSGFVLHLSCSKARLSLASYAGFQVRRVFRIYPLYYFSLLVVSAVIFSHPRSAFPAFGGNDGAKLVLAADHGNLYQWLQQLFLVTPDFGLVYLTNA